MTTDTPRTDACPHCHSENYSCGTTKEKMANGDFRSPRLYQSELCREREKSQKLEAEVERLSKLMADCLNVIRVYCPTYFQDAMDRFNKTDK